MNTYFLTRRVLSFLLFITIGFQANVFSQIDYKGFPQWSKHQLDSTEYMLYTPSHLKAGQKYPIALFMHGCCGVDYHASLRNAVDPPARMWHNFGANTQSIPTYIISPATSRGWTQHFDNLKKVIDDLVANHQGDPQRIYVCGFSMGGDGTVRIVQQYPGFFAAAIPMGMSFNGDSTLLKDIPIWTAQGETDWWARDLRKNVAGIRHLNGYGRDTGDTWVTGVNPRYANFKGVGHGVQWDAASTLPLTAWAYSKVNDGNKYPQVFFETPLYRQTAAAGKPVAIEVKASDADGSIAKVQIYINNNLFKTLTKAPYTTAFVPVAGDNLVDAVAYDNKGKSNTASTIVKVNNAPKIITAKLAEGNLGAFYDQQIQVAGNGKISYFIQGHLPTGMQFFEGIYLRGVPMEKGEYYLRALIFDEDGDKTEKAFTLIIGDKNPNTVLITNARTKKDLPYVIGILSPGETPNFDSEHRSHTTNLEEINFSNTGLLSGLPFIKTDVNDTSETADDFLSFDIDSDATVYIAYEKLDQPIKSSIPAWLTSWKKEPGEIVAQYRYFDLYSKNFPKGKVSLPGADAKRNGVTCNYFVIVKMR